MHTVIHLGPSASYSNTMTVMLFDGNGHVVKTHEVDFHVDYDGVMTEKLCVTIVHSNRVDILIDKNIDVTQVIGDILTTQTLLKKELPDLLPPDPSSSIAQLHLDFDDATPH